MNDRFRAALVMLLCLAMSHASTFAEPTAKEQAARIHALSGLNGGLIVHLGCGGGQLTAALQASENFLVQGLDTKEFQKPRGVRFGRFHQLDQFGFLLCRDELDRPGVHVTVMWGEGE